MMSEENLLVTIFVTCSSVPGRQKCAVLGIPDKRGKGVQCFRPFNSVNHLQFFF